MAAGYNKIILIGNLGADPETRNTPSGAVVCNLRVAVNRGSGDKATTTWFKVTFWEKQAENIGKYFRKGSGILVEGEMTMREYTDKDGNERQSWEVRGYQFGFIDKREDSDGDDRPRRSSRRDDDDDDDRPVRPSKAKRAPVDEDDDDDDEPTPPKKRRPADDDDDEPTPPKKGSSRYR